MAQPLREWIDEHVAPYRDKPVRWLSESHFFRDPIRPGFCDAERFFSPADGVLIYQLHGKDSMELDVKGESYTVSDILGGTVEPGPCTVCGIFMTFYDVHINRIPYPGRLKHEEFSPLQSFNEPMLDVETALVKDVTLPNVPHDYHYVNQRVINTIQPYGWPGPYYIVQIADYDVDCIVHFEREQNQPFVQGQRFGQIRYGSQVDLIVPQSSLPEGGRLDLIQTTGHHVTAGEDPLIRVTGSCY